MRASDLFLLNSSNMVSAKSLTSELILQKLNYSEKPIYPTNLKWFSLSQTWFSLMRSNLGTVCPPRIRNPRELRLFCGWQGKGSSLEKHFIFLENCCQATQGVHFASKVNFLKKIWERLVMVQKLQIILDNFPYNKFCERSQFCPL